MNIYTKLQQARVQLNSLNLKKSGANKFVGYNYYELGDFMPSILRIFNELGLCGIVSFTKELATLTITDGENQIVINSPMASANLKGCHEIQNLGAVETYQRRYLWVTALEIVESDQLDSSPLIEEKHNYKSITENSNTWSNNSKIEKLKEINDFINKHNLDEQNESTFSLFNILKEVLDEATTQKDLNDFTKEMVAQKSKLTDNELKILREEFLTKQAKITKG